MQIEYNTSWVDVMANFNQRLGFKNASVYTGTMGQDSQFGLVSISVGGNIEYCLIYPTRQTGRTLHATVVGDKITPEVVADVQKELAGR